MIPVLSAHALTSFQDCRRRAALETEWLPTRWRPKSLFDACLRRAIQALSQDPAPAPADVARDAKADFMRVAADTGLDTQWPPYQVARDYCAMLDTILRAIARLTLLVTRPVPDMAVALGTDWRFSSVQDESGTLHRWITVDKWNADALAREMHGWDVMGDMCMAREPMQLHVIEIGQERGGRRASGWARGWQQPGMPRLQLRFRRKDGKGFQGWTPVYFADDRNDPDEWVDRMMAEGACEELLHHATINLPLEHTVEDTRGQIRMELAAMGDLLESIRTSSRVAWRLVPMSRGACDRMVPCPFQEVCYAEVLRDIGELGLYKRREPAWDTKQASSNLRSTIVGV